jgi:hypothetical protein
VSVTVTVWSGHGDLISNTPGPTTAGIFSSVTREVIQQYSSLGVLGQFGHNRVLPAINESELGTRRAAFSTPFCFARTTEMAGLFGTRCGHGSPGMLVTISVNSASRSDTSDGMTMYS